MTINKPQGQAFENVGIDLRKDFFLSWAIALSRVRSWKSVRFYLGHQRTNNTIKNYVYTELYDEKE